MRNFLKFKNQKSPSIEQWNDKENFVKTEAPKTEILESEETQEAADFIDTLKSETLFASSKYTWKSKLLTMSNEEAEALRKRKNMAFEADIATDTSLFDDMQEKRRIVKYVDDFIVNKYASLKLEAFDNMEKRLELRDILKSDAPRLTAFPNAVLDEILEESVGLGVIERIARNKTISEINYNGTELIVESNDQKEVNQTGGYVDGDYIQRLIIGFASTIGKDFNESHPIIDLVFKNFRVSGVHKIVANGTPTISIRVSQPGIMVTEAIIEQMSNSVIANLMAGLVLAKCNIVVCGETGSGKTEMTKRLLSYIPFNEKICLIEDVFEMHAKEIFPDADVESWVVTENADASELLSTAMRHDPTWVAVTELRKGKEANQWHQALRSDHSSITSLHAASALMIPNRVMGMIGEVRNIQEERTEDEIKSLLNIGIHIKFRWIEGHKRRWIADIVEFRSKAEGDSIVIFEQDMDAKGKTTSKMQPISKDLYKRLASSGFNLSKYDQLISNYEK
ncbi:ATPase, T2SS/T4P/T4SS family [Lactovum miscens]|uniref:Pilus assembly protein CpaF n=1 Tax=Lactovum miscens TaxID=190387 RepID=A0A841C469_9LACT|nr:ATPase, T2SS/T4P/T4SS family [Lactovum miscens]MBB5887613.1 pilus assembly protein CpaF [Lactovum miscens]